MRISPPDDYPGLALQLIPFSGREAYCPSAREVPSLLCGERRFVFRRRRCELQQNAALLFERSRSRVGPMGPTRDWQHSLEPTNLRGNFHNSAVCLMSSSCSCQKGDRLPRTLRRRFLYRKDIA